MDSPPPFLSFQASHIPTGKRDSAMRAIVAVAAVVALAASSDAFLAPTPGRLLPSTPSSTAGRTKGVVRSVAS